MKIALLSRNKKLYSTRRLVEAAEARGHEINVIDVLRCYMNITSHNPTILIEISNRHLHFYSLYSIRIQP